MALLKNTIFIVLLLLFSLKFARCQENSEEITGPWEEAPVVYEETPIACEETTVTESWEEATSEATEIPFEEWCQPTEETPIEEVPTEEIEEVIEEEEGSRECPRFIEETEVNGHWMTFHPCCVSSGIACSSSHEPVCIEELRCEADHCRRHYETVTNVCLACKGQGTWIYSIGECPWEKNAF